MLSCVNFVILLSFHVAYCSDDGLYSLGGDTINLIGRTAVEPEALPKIWADGVIIYRIDPRIGCPDSKQCELLMRAFDHYQSKTCLRFQEWTGEKDYIKIFFNKDSGACWSAVGKQGGVQPVSLGYRCWYLGIIIHELGHSVGFFHEMNRPDRDDFIEIFWDNIKPGYANVFQKNYMKISNSFDDKFDYKSIMMYDEYAFAKDKKSQTIAAKDKSVIGPIWRKPGLSTADIHRIDTFYLCNGTTRNLPLFPQSLHCSFNKNACGFKNGGKALWHWGTVNDTDGYIFTSSNGSHATAIDETTTYTDVGFLMSVNFHPVTDASKSSFGCFRFWYMGNGNETYLKVRQSFLTRTTQLAFIAEDTFDVWETDDNLNSDWTFVELDIYVTTPFKLIFESGFGVLTKGFIAVDDVDLIFSPCASLKN